MFKFRRRRFEMEWVPEPSLRAPTLIRLSKSFDPIEVRVEPRASVRVVEEGRALFVEVRTERAGKHAIAVEGCA